MAESRGGAAAPGTYKRRLITNLKPETGKGLPAKNAKNAKGEKWMMAGGSLFFTAISAPCLFQDS
jgi:hypothetical protein